MPEEQIQETEVTQPEVEQEVTSEQDLVTRASRIPLEQPNQDEGKFNINDLDAQIERINDPAMKEQVLGLKKSLLRGENQKYQEIAELRKKYETSLAQQSEWTPERLREELKNPSFKQVAQSIVEEQQSSTNSMLSEEEQALLNDNTKKINSLTQANQALLRQQEDSVLKGKYANYDPNVVDKAITDVAHGRIRMTREDIWKAIDYTNGMKRAYKLREQDTQRENKDKISGMTIDNTVNMTQPTGLVKEKGESTQQFMRRSYQHHAKKK